MELFIIMILIIICGSIILYDKLCAHKWEDEEEKKTRICSKCGKRICKHNWQEYEMKRHSSYTHSNKNIYIQTCKTCGDMRRIVIKTD